MSARIVRVHIHELVLEGVAPADRYRVADAVQVELAQLLAGDHAPSFIASVDRLDAGAFQAGAPSSIGPQVAKALYNGLTR